MPSRLWPLLLVAVLGLRSSAPRLEWELQSSGVTARLRGLSAVSSQVAWASGANGTVLRTVDGGVTWQPRPIEGASSLDFRDVDAFSDDVAYVLSIGPGDASRIYKTSDGGAHWDPQFGDKDPKVFLDAMAFWDADHGVAVGDSVADALFILTTANGGRTWTRLDTATLPRALPHEGAFAASGTNVAVSGREDAWIATGAGRVHHSSDGGRSWSVSTTPVPSGESSGIFSVAFRDRNHGVVVGGDYRNETAAVNNAALTSDAGTTWRTSSRGLSGYRSVVASVPSTKGAYVAAGPSGVDWSVDDGRTWTAVSAAGVDTVSFAPRTRGGWGAGDHGRLAKLVIHD
jgi:photosystem II stability/assembly factor-like uncharacterized protein